MTRTVLLRSLLGPPKRRRSLLREWLRHPSRSASTIGRRVRTGYFQRSLAFVTAGAALLSGLEVAFQHYRGGFSQRKMYSPLVTSAALTGTALWTVFNRRPSRWLLPLASALLTLNGVVGFYFHGRGVARKPGGWRLPVFNVSMGPPILAPLLLGMPGYLGLVTSLLHREEDHRADMTLWRPRGWGRNVRQGRFQRQMAGAASIAALLSGFEALYSHYKTNFRFRAQWTPIIIAPALAAAGIAATVRPIAARSWLPAMSTFAVVDGLAGFGYHIRGVLRRPGGARLPLYNVVYGPPIFAPLLFMGAGFMGLLASAGRRRD